MEGAVYFNHMRNLSRRVRIFVLSLLSSDNGEQSTEASATDTSTGYESFFIMGRNILLFFKDFIGGIIDRMAYASAVLHHPGICPLCP